MLEKVVVLDLIQVLESGHIQVRQVTKVLEDGVELSKAYQRWVCSPGDDVSSQDERVKAIAGVVWTPAVIAAYRERQLASGLMIT